MALDEERRKRIRRRIEDALRKIADDDMLLWIANLLKLKTD